MSDLAVSLKSLNGAENREKVGRIEARKVKFDYRLLVRLEVVSKLKML